MSAHTSTMTSPIPTTKVTGTAIAKPALSIWNTTYSFAIYSLPAAYLLAFPPHIYSLARMMSASSFSYSNLTPRNQLETLATRLPAATVDSLWRARGVHLNALEGFPIFASAMILGTYAKLEPAELNTCAAEYLGTRVLYSLLYMTVRGEAASYLRSASYFVNLSIPLWVLWKAGQKVAASADGAGANGERGRKEL